MPSLGRSIQRDFEVREYLGKSGKVLRAFQPGLQREVVLKVLNPKFFDPAEARRKFIEAGRLLGGLRHPNVVQVYGVEVPEGEDPYLVMEFIEGTSLKKILREEKRLAYPRALGYAEGILGALAGIHEHGVVHRNLKPENLIVDGDGRVRLVDFGLALSPERAGEEVGDVVLGTPIYMSPEQVKGKPLDPRSDVYAAGVILYEMLVGRAPFKGQDPREIMRAHVKSPVPKPSEHGVELPGTARHVLRKCLAKSPDKRYRDAKTVLARVRSLLKEHAAGGDHARAAVKRKRRQAAKRHDRFKRVLQSVGVLGFAALGLGFWWRAVARLDRVEAGPVRVEAAGRGRTARFTWTTTNPEPTRLQYGYGPGLELAVNREPARRDHVIELTDLTAGRTLHYRVYEGDERWGEPATLELASAWTMSEVRVRARAVRAGFAVDLEAPRALALYLAPGAGDAGAAAPGGAFPGPAARTAPATASHTFEVDTLAAGSRYRGRIEVVGGGAREFRDFEFTTEEVTAEPRFANPDGVPLTTAPRALGGEVVFGDEAGRVTRVGAGGEVRWQARLAGPLRALEVGPAGVAARAGERALALLDPASGAARWRVELPAPGVGAPALGDGVVVVALKDKRLRAVETGAGGTLWERPTPAAPSSGPGLNPRPGRFEAVAGFADGVLRGFGPGGRPRWQQAFGATVEARPRFRGVGVAAVGGARYLRMRESRRSPRVALSLARPTQAFEVGPDRVLLLSAEGTLEARDWASATKVWQRHFPAGLRGRPVWSGGRVYVLTGDDGLACLAGADGRTLYRARLAAAGAVEPLPAPEGCYVATYGGQLFLVRD